MLPLFLPLILLFSATTDACLPMQPPDDLPCPMPPIKSPVPASTDDAYEDSKMIGPTTENGATVYKCPYHMKSGSDSAIVDGELSLVCEPNSGFFVVKGGASSRKAQDGQYFCQEKACKKVTDVLEKTIPFTTPLPTKYSFGGDMTQEKDVKNEANIIAVCPEGDALYDVDNPDVPILVDGVRLPIPVCVRDSGMWFPEEKKYRCLKKSCDAVKEAATNEEYCPLALVKCDKGKFNRGDATVAECVDPFMLAYSEKDAGRETAKIGKLTCQGSGEWANNDGLIIKEPHVNCAEDRMCKACTMPKILEPAKCAITDTANFCSGEVTVEADSPSKCDKLLCKEGFFSIVKQGGMLEILEGGTTFVCDNKQWMFNSMERTDFGEGVVCTKKSSNCEACYSKVTGVYDKDDMNSAPIGPDNIGELKSGTTCTYTCKNADFGELVSDGKLYSSITCDIINNEMSIFNPQGPSIDGLKWFCQKCACVVVELPQCPPNMDCIRVGAMKGDGCTYTCPAEFAAYYKDMSNMIVPVPTGTILKCTNGMFPLANYGDALGCVKAKPIAECLPAKPTTIMCDALMEVDFKEGGNSVGMFGDLCYLEDDKTVTCTKGVLYYEPRKGTTMTGAFPKLICRNDLKWADELNQDTPTKATCVPDINGVDTCLEFFKTKPDPYVDYKCLQGVCKIFCKQGRKIRYGDGSMTTVDATCVDNGEMYTDALEYVDNAECVVA